MDQPGADGEKSLAELREQLSPDIYWFPEEGLEAAAEDLAAVLSALFHIHILDMEVVCHEFTVSSQPEPDQDYRALNAIPGRGEFPGMEGKRPL